MSKSVSSTQTKPTSGQCPLCNLFPEDVLHMLFHCQTVVHLWRALGLDDIIHNTMQTDCSGSVVVEELLRSSLNIVPGYTSFELHELIAITCWYIWWLRRRRTHGETIPPIPKCAASIRGLAANYAKATKLTMMMIKRELLVLKEFLSRRPRDSYHM